MIKMIFCAFSDLSQVLCLTCDCCQLRCCLWHRFMLWRQNVSQLAPVWAIAMEIYKLKLTLLWTERNSVVSKRPLGNVWHLQAHSPCPWANATGLTLGPATRKSRPLSGFFLHFPKRVTLPHSRTKKKKKTDTPENKFSPCTCQLYSLWNGEGVHRVVLRNGAVCNHSFWPCHLLQDKKTKTAHTRSTRRDTRATKLKKKKFFIRWKKREDMSGKLKTTTPYCEQCVMVEFVNNRVWSPNVCAEQTLGVHVLILVPKSILFLLLVPWTFRCMSCDINKLCCCVISMLRPIQFFHSIRDECQFLAREWASTHDPVVLCFHDI